MLKGKVAIITGGSRGIGAAITEKLASMGADVAVLFAGRKEPADAVCDKCRELYGVEARAYCCDVSDFEAAKQTVVQIRKDFGTVDILINNAGITRDGLIAAMTEQDFDAVLNTNLKGAFNMIRHCSGIFIRSHAGRIVNVSSVSGMMGNAGQANYSASKAGIIGLTKSVAKELASRGVTCNAVAPGFIATDMTKALPQDTAQIAAAIPLGRLGTAEEVAQAVAFLVSSEYITGEILRIDGGIAM